MADKQERNPSESTIKPGRYSSIDGEDFISSMPDEILHHIISFIPTTYLTVKTSVLSRRWKHVWCETPCLSFHGLKTTARGINQTLMSYRALKITSFRLDIAYYVTSREINRWIQFAMFCNVQKLSVSFLNYTCPEFFFLSSSLEQLYVRSASIPRCTVVSWKSLRNLRLYNCNLSDNESLANILSGCPILETLELSYCRGSLQCLDLSKSVTLSSAFIPRCTVSWKSIRNLRLGSCNLCDDESLASILSGCPILETLELTYCIGSNRRLDLSKSPTLTRVEIRWNHFSLEIIAPHIHYLRLAISDEKEEPCTLVDVSSVTEVYLDMCIKPTFLSRANFVKIMVMLEKLQNVESLTFGRIFLQMLSFAELHGIPFPTLNIHTLIVETMVVQSAIPSIARLLQNAPGLKKLIVSALYDGDRCDIEVDSSLVPEYMHNFPTSKGIHSMVRCKNATSNLFASFMELVLRKSKTLEMMVIHFKSPVALKCFENLLQRPPPLSHNNVSITLNPSKYSLIASVSLS